MKCKLDPLFRLLISDGSRTERDMKKERQREATGCRKERVMDVTRSLDRDFFAGRERERMPHLISSHLTSRDPSPRSLPTYLSIYPSICDLTSIRVKQTHTCAGPSENCNTTQ